MITYSQNNHTFADNLSSWETFETQRVECHRLLDVADKDFASIKKIFDLKAGPNDFRQESYRQNNEMKGCIV